MNKVLLSIAAASLAMSLAGVAGADELDRPGQLDLSEVSLTVGGGVTGFVGRAARDAASVGGAWEARVGVSTRQMFSAEVAYIGTAQPIEAIGVDDNALLVGTGLEADARVNLLTGTVQPYFLAGAGWTRYDVTNTDANTSDMADSDNVFHAPLGIGADHRVANVLLDARAVYRLAAASDLLATSADGKANRLDSWTANLRAGFEF